MSTEDLRIALRKRYPMPEWCLMEEVRDATGHAGLRSADAVAMGLWPSRGLLVTGFEIKASRADWRRELKNPVKAESIMAFCDHWYVVALPDVVKDGELPPTWGLLELAPRKLLVVKTEAPKNTAVLPLSRAFVASMMRRAGEYDALQLELKLSARTNEIFAQQREYAEQEIARAKATAEASQTKTLALFAQIKERTGIDLPTWTPTDEIVRRIAFATASKSLTSTHVGLTGVHRAIQKLDVELVAAMRTLEVPVNDSVNSARVDVTGLAPAGAGGLE